MGNIYLSQNQSTQPERLSSPSWHRYILGKKGLGTKNEMHLGMHHLLPISHQVKTVLHYTCATAGSCAQESYATTQNPQHLCVEYNFMLGKLALCKVIHPGELNPLETNTSPLLSIEHYHRPLL